MVLRGTGTSGMGADGRTDQAVGIALYGRAAGRLRSAPTWAVRLDVLGGSTAPQRPNVGVDRDSPETVTSWGVGFVAALGGIEAVRF